jgi:hypothetical protein
MSNSEFKKDVFVSYSSSDLAWVQDELLKRLRDARINYIEPRDFEKGAIRLNEVENAIKFSRRTLLVVTSSFLSDAWNEFENGMAFSFVLETGSWRIVPVIKEENLDLPPRLGALVPFKPFSASEEEWEQFAVILFSEPPSTARKPPKPPVTERTIAPTPPPEPKEDHSARNGLALLPELMENVEIRGPLSEFRAYFEGLCERIETLDRLKKLHDGFQQLEDIYNNIKRYGKSELSGQIDWEDIEIVEPDLAVKVRELVRRGCESSFATADDIWIQKLNRVLVELPQAIDSKNVSTLRTATNRLADILNSVPPRINTSMVTEAKGLRLTALERVLMTVHGIMKDCKPQMATSGQLAKIEKSAEKIDEMDRRLKTLLFVHDSLQEVDSELRRVDRSLNEGIYQVQELWHDLKPKMLLLCADEKFDWAVELAAAGRELESSFSTSDDVQANESKIRRAFRFYRSQTNRSFNQVDGEMLTRCNELKNEIGKPLAPLLAMLQEASEE